MTVIFSKETELSELQVREIQGGEKVGISIYRTLGGDFIGRVHAEYFIDKNEAEELVEALQEYFQFYVEKE
jgi:hypothetical protein